MATYVAMPEGMKEYEAMTTRPIMNPLKVSSICFSIPVASSGLLATSMRSRRGAEAEAKEAEAGGGGEGAAQDDGKEEAEALEPAAAAEAVDEEGAAASEDEKKPRRHPKCASGEECLGSPDDGLMQQTFLGTYGDLFCMSCWDMLKGADPSLEGEPCKWGRR
mmetsp:Transcript_43010/g.108097  ORF Transcript_43010/g.108097 Transcript_43010/m.108097 type:complete len:163 (-) Transcript_43010:50-538(-)